MPGRKHSAQRVSPQDEFSRIAWLSKLFASKTRGVSLGIGDDAALLNPTSQQWVWTVDACVQHVHFELGWLSPEDLGWRSLQAAVSDIAAMGAMPVGALVSLALPTRADASMWQGIARGQARAAKSLGCPVIGGNLSGAAEISIHTTVLGQAEHPILRSGARVGDELWLIGSVGAAAAGRAVIRSVAEDQRDAAMRACVRAWQRPRALLTRGRSLGKHASAAIDVSDGVGGDARHIAEASRVAVVIDAPALERAAGARVSKVAAALQCSALDWALTGGEDYALLATGKSQARPAFARRIGRVERGHGAWLEAAGGRRTPLDAGFSHFK